MHSVIEKARKSAGISGLTKNYPDNPKQRGCGYWAAFMGSIANDLARVDDDRLNAAKKAEGDIRHWATRCEELEAECNKLRGLLQERGLQVLAHHQGWSIDEGQEASRMIAG